LAVAGTVAGTAAAVVAYQSAASVGSGTEPASVKTDNPTAATTSWLPCERGWKLVVQTCVRVKKKVVVVHDLPAPAAEPARSAGVRSDASGGGTSHSARDDDSDESEPSDDDSVENEAEDESGDDSQDVGEDESGSEDVGGDD
jgi:hypothetical protein